MFKKIFGFGSLGLTTSKILFVVSWLGLGSGIAAGISFLSKNTAGAAVFFLSGIVFFFLLRHWANTGDLDLKRNELLTAMSRELRLLSEYIQNHAAYLKNVNDDIKEKLYQIDDHMVKVAADGVRQSADVSHQVRSIDTRDLLGTLIQKQEELNAELRKLSCDTADLNNATHLIKDFFADVQKKLDLKE